MYFETSNSHDLPFWLSEAENLHTTVGKKFPVAFLVSDILVFVPEILVCAPVEPVSCIKLEWRESVIIMEQELMEKVNENMVQIQAFVTQK